MKKILFLLTATTTIGINTMMAYEDITPSIWQEIKKYEEALDRQIHGFRIQTDWNKYHNSRAQKENLFHALVYAEKQCSDADNTLQQRKKCETVLVRPLVIAYIEKALSHEQDRLIEYFSPENQQKHQDYINFLKEQKENLRIKPMRPIREC